MSKINLILKAEKALIQNDTDDLAAIFIRMVGVLEIHPVYCKPLLAIAGQLFKKADRPGEEDVGLMADIALGVAGVERQTTDRDVKSHAVELWAKAFAAVARNDIENAPGTSSTLYETAHFSFENAKAGGDLRRQIKQDISSYWFDKTGGTLPDYSEEETGELLADLYRQLSDKVNEQARFVDHKPAQKEEVPQSMLDLLRRDDAKEIAKPTRKQVQDFVKKFAMRESVNG